jgi:hypothetical protein
MSAKETTLARTFIVSDQISDIVITEPFVQSGVPLRTFGPLEGGKVKSPVRPAP